MSRPIDADALIKDGYILHRTYQQNKKTMVYEIKQIKDVPTMKSESKWIADVVNTIEMLSAKLHAYMTPVDLFLDLTDEEKKASRGYAQGYADALKDMNRKWTLCQERPPEEDGDYLVLYYTRSKYKPYVYDVMSFANDLYKIDEYDFYDKKGQSGWFHCDREYGFCEDNDVYAWMPLPEPYKGEGECE